MISMDTTNPLKVLSFQKKKLGDKKFDDNQHLKWFATWDKEHDAYVIHSEHKRNLVWTSAADYKKVVTNGVFNLSVYEHGNEKQLWRRAGSDTGSFFIYPFEAGVDKNCKGFDIWNAKFKVLELDSCNFDIDTETWGGKKSQLWNFVESNPVPILPRKTKSIVQIHNVENGSMMIYNKAPTEEHELTSIAFDAKDGMHSWWILESIDNHTVIHSFADPDMVWGLTKGKDGIYHLKLEKYIPGDQRQLFKHNKKIESLNAKLMEGEKAISLTSHKIDSAGFEQNNDTKQQKWKTLTVAHQKIFPANFVIEFKQGKKTIGAVLKSGEHITTRKSGADNTEWVATAMNNGHVIRSKNNRNLVWTLLNLPLLGGDLKTPPHDSIILSEYFPGDPNQIFQLSEEDSKKKLDGIFLRTPKNFHESFNSIGVVQWQLEMSKSGKLFTGHVNKKRSNINRFKIVIKSRDNDFPTSNYFSIFSIIAKKSLAVQGSMGGTYNNEDLVTIQTTNEDDRRQQWYAVRLEGTKRSRKGYFICSRMYNNYCWTLSENLDTIKLRQLGTKGFYISSLGRKENQIFEFDPKKKHIMPVPIKNEKPKTLDLFKNLIKAGTNVFLNTNVNGKINQNY